MELINLNARASRTTLPHVPVGSGLVDACDAPLICIALNPRNAEAILDCLIENDLRPVSLQIAGEAHMLELGPKLALDDGSMSLEFRGKLLERGAKIVKWAKFRDPQDKQISTVTPDYRSKAHLAAAHFAERGFKNVAYIGWEMFAEVDIQQQAFEKHAQVLGMMAYSYKWKSDGQGKWWSLYAKHGQLFRAWLDKVGTPLGVFAADDRLAALICMYCNDLGLDVPVDIAILGVGERPDICMSSPVSISYIAMDRVQMLDMVQDLLMRSLAGELQKPEHLMYQPRGIELHQSSDVLASVDRDVANALRYIWMNYRKNIAVNAIAKAVGVKRYDLERRFRKELNRGIAEELRAKRMHVFLDLLESTDMPIADISADAGFFSQSYLFRVFKREFGMTPRHYRARCRADRSIEGGSNL